MSRVSIEKKLYYIISCVEYNKTLSFIIMGRGSILDKDNSHNQENNKFAYNN